MQRVSLALRARLGDEAVRDLEEFVAVAGDQWKEQVMQTAAERFDNRLAAVAGDLRLEMAELRVEMQKGLSEIWHAMADLRVELLRWSFFFWVGQVVAVASLLAFMLRGVMPK